MKPKLRALLDTNVVIAAVAEAHEHHEPSVALFAQAAVRDYAVAAHSYAEAYSVLTRPSRQAPFGWSAQDAWGALESVAAITGLVGLTHGQSFDAIRNYALSGGIGARLYDKLIGQVAVHNHIPMIVTWNVKHLTGLFPDYAVLTPEQACAALTHDETRSSQP